MPTVSISVSDIAYRYLHAGKKGSRVDGVSARANRAIVDWIKADQLTKDIQELRKEMAGLRADKKQLYLLLVDAGHFEPLPDDWSVTERMKDEIIDKALEVKE